MTAVSPPRMPPLPIPAGYQPHRWLAAPAGQPGTATQVITGDDMSYCTACRKWFRYVTTLGGSWAVGTDGEHAVGCPGYDWHGPECNCFGHPQPAVRGHRERSGTP